MFKGHATALLPSMLAITVLILAAIICPGHDNHVLITLQVCAVPQLPGTHTEARHGFQGCAKPCSLQHPIMFLTKIPTS